VTHVSFPLRTTASGRTSTAGDDAYVRGLVEAVLFTRGGERPNRPDFGSGIEQLVFGPVDDETAHATQALVHGALQRHLGEQLRVEDVTVEAEEATLRVTVVYQPLLSGPSTQRRTLTVVGGGA
jgi:phage baseplate assembly protein W